jgi:hypothetical protein
VAEAARTGALLYTGGSEGHSPGPETRGGAI